MSTVRYITDDLAAYQEAESAILGLIHGHRADSRCRTDRQRRAQAKLERTRRLLQALGDPQHRYPTIHVTGTSGKGSTSVLIASILTAAGYRVGLRTSPFLQVATEKLQIGSSLIDAASFLSVTKRVLATATATLGGIDYVGYAEAWSAISFQWFAERNVDLAVIEVGAGGRFDSTNVIEPIVSVITSVGMDHVVSLGPTIADIAWHKAGIIKAGGVAVIGAMPAEARRVVDERAAEVGALVIDTSGDCGGHDSSMRGSFQRANAMIAHRVALALNDIGYALPDAAIRAGMAAARLPGRLEPMPAGGGPIVWIDGAHNADKISAVAREARQLAGGHDRPVIVLGLLASKDASLIVDALIPAASAIVATQPDVLGKTALPASKLADIVQERGFTGEVVTVPRPCIALERAMKMADDAGACVLVTGSLYLAGQLRSRWYPDDDIVLQRTSWPQVALTPTPLFP